MEHQSLNKIATADFIKTNRKNKWTLLVLSVALLFVFALALMCGRYKIPISDIINVLTGQEANLSSYNVLIYLRIPRTLAAILVGASLALSGAVYQSTFNNPLVSPDVLGVSSGAAVGASIAILLNFSYFGITVLSLIMGVISVCIALILPKLIRNTSMLSLVLSGIIVNAIMNSLLGLVKYLVDGTDKLSSITFWMMGGFSNIKYTDVLYLLPIVVVCCTILLLLRWRINVLSLGKEGSITSGVKYRLVRMVIIVCTTLLTAVSVSVSGSISWIGLAMPHIARLLCGNDNRFTLPCTMLCGSIFMVVVDILSRCISVNEIPLSIMTGILGAVIYISVLIKKGKDIR